MNEPEVNFQKTGTRRTVDDTRLILFIESILVVETQEKIQDEFRQARDLHGI